MSDTVGHGVRAAAAAVLAVAAAVLTIAAGAFAPAAAAAPTATLHVSPSTQAAGGSVQVSGTCEANSSGYAISHAFLHDAGHDFAGVGAVSFSTDASGSFSVTAQIPAGTAPGSYEVSARCGGGNLGITATLTITSGTPTAVPAGSGGLAPGSDPGSRGTQFALAGLGGALVLGGGLALAVRRRAAR